ncbi:hypothetical protein QUF57_13345 [Bacillus pumilus]|nr:hypothetical protein [Bacillus pumilus]MDM5320959.1 hypothetical protein [Bacillus pumilus]
MQGYFEDFIESIKSYFVRVGTNIIAFGGALLLLVLALIIYLAGMH